MQAEPTDADLHEYVHHFFDVEILGVAVVPALKDSRPMVERRFKCLEKRLQQNPVLYDSVRRQIEDFKPKDSRSYGRGD